MQKMKRTYLFGALILIGGILIGGCAMNFYQRYRWKKILHQAPTERAETAVERFVSRYDLPANARESVTAAFGVFFAQMSEAQQIFGEAMKKNYAELTAQMQKNLPPEIFSAWQAEQQKLRARRRLDNGRRPHRRDSPNR